MGQIQAPALNTPMGYDPSTHLWLPIKLKPMQTDASSGEEYAPLGLDDLGDVSDAAWSGAGSGSAIAILKKVVAGQTGTATIINGATIGLPLIMDDIINRAIVAGQAFEAYESVPSGGATGGGISIFNNATAKSALIYSVKVSLAASGSVNMFTKATDFALGAVTAGPFNRSVSNATTSLMTVSGVATAVSTAGGTQRKAFNLLANTPYQLLDKPYYIQNGVAGALAITTGIPGAGTNFVLVEWIEF